MAKLHYLLFSFTLGISSCSDGWAQQFDPVAFKPEKVPPLEGAYSVNERLVKAERLADGKLNGPEDIAISPSGEIYTGSADGEIVRVSRDGQVASFAKTGGHPLGMDFDAQGNLIVCEPYSGLLKISPEGEIEVLLDQFEGEKFGLLDDVKVATDGRIYFTDASYKYPLHQYQLDIMEGRPNGRLFRYDPQTGKTELLLDQLYFANGIAFSTDEDFLVVAETARYRMTRYWLRGENAGKREIFLDNLPGYPDTISSNRQGRIWVAFFSIRSPEIDFFQQFPWLKRLFAKLPASLLPSPKPYGLVAAYNEDGEVVDSLHDPQGKTLSNITSVEEFQGELIMGTLTGNALGVIAID